jgi:hypothetical protein
MIALCSSNWVLRTFLEKGVSLAAFILPPTILGLNCEVEGYVDAHLCGV